ncbi:MAG: hypothetical protein U9P81_11065 [Euryarchaeota archaeon]|nr:hypothetical protein [Euryarchaeota archaeon]
MTEIPEEWRIRRFAESSPEAPKEMNIRKCEAFSEYQVIFDISLNIEKGIIMKNKSILPVQFFGGGAEKEELFLIRKKIFK